MSDFGLVTEAGAVRFDRLLPGPVERVWSFLTDSDKRGRWLAFGAMEGRVGATFRLEFHNCKLGPGDTDIPAKYRDNCQDGVATHGVIQAWEPFRLLSFTWAEEGTPSLVTIELSEEGDKVRLVLTHRRLDNRDMMISVSGGWHTHLDVLAAELSGTPAPGFWTRHTALEAEYEGRLP
ncbi:SRPBCC family protein [Niveispirillum sp. KHB5.9]|uniref:SRPBCC family protein n=1 Tax=Niveispirillum sp. KHB5.9 TaxID=3400269 RepID=UPI003A8B8A3E